MVARIKTGDKVVVITGADKGRSGRVLEVDPKSGRARVEGVRVVKRHQKPNQMDPGGIKTFEGFVDLSNLAHADPRDGKATRVGVKTDDHGRKFRFAKRSGEAIDG